MSEPGRVIACPSCATGYFLPEELIGSGGARVRCPQCKRVFVVEAHDEAGAGAAPASRSDPHTTTSGMPEAGVAPPPAAPAGAAERIDVAHPPAGAPPDAAASTGSAAAEPASAAGSGPGSDAAAPGPDQLAHSALDALAEQIGESVAHAAAEGRLFAEHGREIMASFDAWRREAGRDADPAVFRTALRERWGVDFE